MPWSVLLPADVVLATRMAVKLSQVGPLMLFDCHVCSDRTSRWLTTQKLFDWS